MINTYHSSAAPPPVPPRLHSSHQGPQPVLIPTTMLPQGPSRTLLRVMMAVVLLNLLMSILGFLYLYLYKTGKPLAPQEMPSPSTGAGPEVLMLKQDSNHITKRELHKAFAQVVVETPSQPQSPQSGHLKWDKKFSRFSHPYINYYNSSWLTIELPGYYFVYSRVTFSKSHPTLPLTNKVMMRKSKDNEEKIIMQAFCSTVLSLCTATAEEVIKLEKGNQLSVWTEDLSLVRYDSATAFGLFHLW